MSLPVKIAYKTALLLTEDAEKELRDRLEVLGHSGRVFTTDDQLYALSETGITLYRLPDTNEKMGHALMAGHLMQMEHDDGRLCTLERRYCQALGSRVLSALAHNRKLWSALHGCTHGPSFRKLKGAQ